MRFWLKSLSALAVVSTLAVPLVSSAPSSAATVPTCSAANLRLGVGPKFALMPGEHAVIFTLTNRLIKKCQLKGYPGVALYDANGKVLKVQYNTLLGSTSPFVTRSAPKAVVLIPGARAYFKIAKYGCDVGVARTAKSMAISIPGVSGPVGKLRIVTPAVRTFASCQGSSTGRGQLVGVSPFTSTLAATYANAPAASTTFAACNYYTNWPTKTVTADVVNAVTKYYISRNLAPITIANNREWIVPLATQRVGTHWCLNADGSVSGYTGSVPLSATAAVMVYVHHKPYPVTEAPSHFVILAKIAGVWKVVAENTGP
ncbi:MAG TPA: DUF4232 domain-containing protein [Acidimicrobiales bacterium]|nr:DUF4232 domain-containing protein [Acidimicrobiales bacterium]